MCFGDILLPTIVPSFRYAATKAFKKLVTDKAEVDGLPQSALAMAAQQAAADSKEGDEASKPTAEEGPWLFTLDAPSFMPVQSHAKNRCTLTAGITKSVLKFGFKVLCVWRVSSAAGSHVLKCTKRGVFLSIFFDRVLVRISGTFSLCSQYAAQLLLYAISN